jgi:hypothetical protein
MSGADLLQWLAILAIAIMSVVNQRQIINIVETSTRIAKAIQNRLERLEMLQKRS